MLAIAWAFSLDRRRVPWRVVVWGLALQLGLGVLLLETPVGAVFFAGMNALVSALGSYTDAGVALRLRLARSTPASRSR